MLHTTAKALKRATEVLKLTAGKGGFYRAVRIAGNICTSYDGTTATEILVPGSGDLEAWISIDDLVLLSKAAKGNIELTNGDGRITMGAVSVPVSDAGAGALELDSITHEVEVCSARLLDSLNYVLPYASTDNSRATIHGVFLERTSDDEITLTATDMHRLATVSVGADVNMFPSSEWEGDENRPGFIMPLGTATQAARLAKRYPTETVSIRCYGDHVAVECDRWRVVGNLYAESYPRYRMVIPDYFGFKSKLDINEALIESVVEAAAVTNGKGKPVFLSVDSCGVTVAASRGESTIYNQLVACKTNGYEISVTFNARYLKTALAASVGGSLRLIDDRSPARIDGAGTIVIMPMRI